MVLNMADFGKSWKSLQTVWNGSRALINWFLTALATLCVHLRWNRNGRYLADFEQKPWAIAHGFEHGRFWQVLEIAPNCLKRFQTLINGFLTALATLCVDLGWIRKSRNLADFEQKPWTIAHVFEHGRFLQSWKSLQTLWNGSRALLNWFSTALATFCVDLRWICKSGNLADFEQKPWAIAHGFEHGRFWQVLEIAPNSLKRFQSPHKLIFNCFGDLLCRFRVNLQEW